DPAVYNDLQLFIPYDALNMASGDSYDLKFYLSLYDKDGERSFGKSGWYKFKLNMPQSIKVVSRRSAQFSAPGVFHYDEVQIMRTPRFAVVVIALAALTSQLAAASAGVLLDSVT